MNIRILDVKENEDHNFLVIMIEKKRDSQERDCIPEVFCNLGRCSLNTYIT